MVEGIQQGNLPHFTTVKYVTKDGENCTATKQNGVVTVVGDKNGVRQMPLDDFMADFVQNLPKVNLENSPKQDTVSFSGNEHTEPEEGKSSKAALGVLAALGTAVIGAGVYLLTKGKAKKISPIVDDLSKKAEDLTERATDVVKTAKNTVQETIDKAKETVKPTVDEIAAKLAESIAPAMEKIQPAVGKAKETLKPAAGKAGELKDKAKTSFADIMNEILHGNKNTVQTGGKTSQAASKTKSSPKAKSSDLKADTNAKTQPQVVAPKSEAKPVQPKTKAVENEVKVEPKKPEAVKPQEPKKDTIQEILDDLLGHKPAAVLADDAGKAVKDELHIADDLLADAHIDAPKSNSWDEPVDFMKGNGSKAADEVDVFSTSSHLDDPIDYFPQSSSYDEIDDMFKTSQMDDFSSDLGSTFDDFNHGMDDFGSGFDDFGGDMF